MTLNPKEDDLKRRTSMTKENIINSCKKNKLYLTPKLNDVLYLHYQGYQKIENLEEYSGLKCLWLECNAISQITGLEQQTELRCLYLHNNFIRKIENLEHCTQLDTLNLSHNYIKAIEQCNSTILPQLNTLDLSHNSLNLIDGLADLIECKTLSVLDLSHNRIEDVLIVKTLSQMPQLRVLTLTGNPVVSEIPSYRKTLTVECVNLTYLDSRPIFDKDRACAEAWKRGGYEEEKREHMKWVAAQQKKITDSVRATLRFRKKTTENRSPNAMPCESGEKISTNSIGSDDEPAKNSLNNIVTDPPALEKSDTLNQINESNNKTAKSLELGSSETEFEFHSPCSEEIRFTLPQRMAGICDLDETSQQCLSITNESDTASKEFLDVNTRNLFNISLNDEILNVLKPEEKPTIEVLSETNMETTDVEAMNGINANESDNECVENADKSLNSSSPIGAIESTPKSSLESLDKHPIDDNSIPNTEELKPLPKSTSVIKFYCENLDDLKKIDSDSDVDIDEI